jgi:hypothetical protein
MTDPALPGKDLGVVFDAQVKAEFVDSALRSLIVRMAR